jgi:hypothetical protein
MKWINLRKIAVCGSRLFSYKDNATAWLDKYLRYKYCQDGTYENIIIITGGALGIDNAVELYCLRLGIKNLIVHPRWEALGRVAGPIRNRHIMALADEAIAFLNPKAPRGSPGTKHAISIAEKFGVPIQIITQKQLEPVVIKVPRIKGHTVTPEKVDANKKLGKRMRGIFHDADIHSWKKELRGKKLAHNIRPKKKDS